MSVIPTVGIFLFKNNKVLLVKHGEGASHVTGTYGWPGGRFNDGETAKQAAVRELKEETGLSVTEDDLVEFIHDIPPAEIKRKTGESLQFSVQLFVSDTYSGRLHSSKETIPEWVPVSEIDKYPLLPNVSKLVKIVSRVI